MARIEDRVTGWWVFAAILLMVAGVLNVIWGIAAISARSEPGSPSATSCPAA